MSCELRGSSRSPNSDYAEKYSHTLAKGIYVANDKWIWGPAILIHFHNLNLKIRKVSLCRHAVVGFDTEYPGHDIFICVLEWDNHMLVGRVLITWGLNGQIVF